MTVAVGVGARPGVPAAVLRAAVDAVLSSAGLTPADVSVLATVDRRAAEPAVRDLAADRGWRLLALPAAVLAQQPVPNPSGVVAAAVGTPSVAEAAALSAAGPAGALLTPKRISGGVTVALAALAPGLNGAATAGWDRSHRRTGH
ncbi:cobalamin biosynthesis protein [Actinoplanes sp. M2I2]|uniref:cobalamin biosynthesis protein n=1 Tax=Actinoplanes sp. M2I2 TaxID=1734444 RepID=UPI00201FC465|nr:cobalamin biosynthesis protein [Actinoplanes sp. M2I2]